MSARFVANPGLRTAVLRATTSGVDRGAAAFAGYVQRSFSQGAGPSAPGTPPARRSGRLAESVRPTGSVMAGSSVSTRVISDTPYSRIQEYGGTINARDRLLTIPVNERARVLRESTRDLRTLDLTFRPSGSPDNAGFLFDGDELLFVLRDSVTLPARSFFRTGVRSVAAQRDVVAAIASRVASEIGGRRAG